MEEGCLAVASGGVREVEEEDSVMELLALEQEEEEEEEEEREEIPLAVEEVKPTNHAPGEVIRAIEMGDCEKLQTLLVGDVVHARELGSNGTLLYVCIPTNSLQVVRVLLEAKADANAVSTHVRYTPLMRAAWNGYLEPAKLLVAHGARVLDADTSGQTALGYAVDWGRQNVARYLLSLGARDVKASANKALPVWFVDMRNAFDRRIRNCRRATVALISLWRYKRYRGMIKDIALLLAKMIWAERSLTVWDTEPCVLENAEKT